MLCSSAVKFKEVDDTCGPQQDSFPGCVTYWPPVRALRLCLQRLSPQCPTQRAPWDSVSRQRRCGDVLPGRGAVTTAGTSSLGVPGPSPAASLEPEFMCLGPLLIPKLSHSSLLFYFLFLFFGFCCFNSCCVLGTALDDLHTLNSHENPSSQVLFPFYR